jgi:uncharacterized membrane protein
LLAPYLLKIIKISINLGKPKTINMETIRYFHQPTISESLGNGWFVMKKYFLWLLLVVIVCSIFDGSPAKFTQNTEHPFPAMVGLIAFAVLIAILIFIFIRPIIVWGGRLIYLQCARDENPELKNLFVGFQHNYLNIVLTHFLTAIIIGFGFVFLIIPGIVFACRLAFVPYLVMDKGLEPVRAVEESWRLTKGYGWTIFGLALMTIPIVIAGLICLIVGVFPALIWINSSFASLYQAVEFAKSEKAAPPIVTGE